jgi:hypothetical protein
LAKATLIYIPLLFVVMMVSVICQPNSEYIGPGLVLSFVLCFVLLIAGLLPSYIADLMARLFREPTAAERVAKELGVPVIDIKMSEMDPKDLRGLPLDS